MKIRGLLSTNISFKQLETGNETRVLELITENNIQITDARLFLLVEAIQAPLIITDDKRFQKFIENHKLMVETPIQPRTREKMDEWEKENLPTAGLPRVLAFIHRYLDARDPKIANGFKDDSHDFSRLPI